MPYAKIGLLARSTNPILATAATRSRFDAFGKNVPRETFDLVGGADTQVEVIATSQTMDIWYTPDPARAALPPPRHPAPAPARRTRRAARCHP
jgi:hypothetical protein